MIAAENIIDVDKVIENAISKGQEVFSVEQYRKISGDTQSPEEIIKTRINYLESFCRKIIKLELEKLYEQSKKIS